MSVSSPSPFHCQRSRADWTIGGYSLTYFDEYIDELLTQDRVCDIILPRLTQRSVLEETEGLAPRKSLLVSHSQLDELEEQHGLIWDRTTMWMQMDTGQTRSAIRNDVGAVAAAADHHGAHRQTFVAVVHALARPRRVRAMCRDRPRGPAQKWVRKAIRGHGTFRAVPVYRPIGPWDPGTKMTTRSWTGMYSTCIRPLSI